MRTLTLSCHQRWKTGLAIQRNVLSQHTSIGLHSHDFCEVFLVEEGFLHHQLNGREYFLEPGAVCLVMPQDVHQCQVLPSSKTTTFTNIAFQKKLFEEVLATSGKWDLSDFTTGITVPRVDHDFWDMLIRKARLMGDMKYLDNTSRILSFKAFMIDVLVLTMEPINRQGADVPRWLFNACHKMRQKRNFLRGIERFTELSGKSQEHLTRSLKKYYGVTPRSYVTSLRLLHAANLLLETDMNVYDVFLEAGFNSPSHAVSHFAKEFGVTPGKYRKYNRITYS